MKHSRDGHVTRFGATVILFFRQPRIQFSSVG